jgi:hypothetical protein
VLFKGITTGEDLFLKVKEIFDFFGTGLEGNDKCDNRRWQKYVWSFTALFIRGNRAAEYFHADEECYGYCDFNRGLNLMQRLEPPSVPTYFK